MEDQFEDLDYDFHLATLCHFSTGYQTFMLDANKSKRFILRFPAMRILIIEHYDIAGAVTDKLE